MGVNTPKAPRDQGSADEGPGKVTEAGAFGTSR